jgi:hypothetical protein
VDVTMRSATRGVARHRLGVGVPVARGGDDVIIRGRSRSRGGSEQAAAAVEMALVLPILILLVFGIAEFGRVYNIQISLTGAAREGVRAMAIENDEAAAREATIRAAAMNVEPAVSVSPAPCTPGDPVRVTARRTVTYTIPFFGPRTLGLEGIGEMRCGG